MDKSIVYYIFFWTFIFILLIIMLRIKSLKISMAKKRKENEMKELAINKKNMALQLLNSIDDFNIQNFLNDRYNDFVAVQIAWMEFDYDKLKELLTDELYNQYLMQLETLKNECSKNIMYDFRYISSSIMEASIENQILTIKIQLECSFNDFIEKLGYVTRGNTDVKFDNSYELTYVCNLLDKGDFCPNCGSKVDKRRNKCSYCGSIFANIPSKWVMANKVLKIQKILYE